MITSERGNESELWSGCSLDAQGQSDTLAGGMVTAYASLEIAMRAFNCLRKAINSCLDIRGNPPRFHFVTGPF